MAHKIQMIINSSGCWQGKSLLLLCEYVKETKTWELKHCKVLHNIPMSSELEEEKQKHSPLLWNFKSPTNLTYSYVDGSFGWLFPLAKWQQNSMCVLPGKNTKWKLAGVSSTKHNAFSTIMKKNKVRKYFTDKANNPFSVCIYTYSIGTSF